MASFDTSDQSSRAPQAGAAPDRVDATAAKPPAAAIMPPDEEAIASDPAPPADLKTRARWLRRVAYDLTRDRDSAEDLVQDTFVAWLRRPDQIEAAGDGWLRTVLKNLHIDRVRAIKVRQRLDPQQADEGGLGGEPDHSVDVGRIVAALEREIDGLTEPFRTTLRLSYFEDLSSSDVARRLGVPAATVRRRNQIALRQLRKRLERTFRSSGEVRGVLSRLAVAPLAAFARPGRRLTWLAGSTPVRVGVAISAWVAAVAVVPWAASRSPRAIASLVPRTSASSASHEGAFAGAAQVGSPAGAAVANQPPSQGSGDEASGSAVGAERAEAPGQGGCPSLQRLVDGARAGDTVVVPACLYREAPVIDKPLTLEAAPGAEIRGSDVFTFRPRADGLWESVESVPSFAAAYAGNCTQRTRGICNGLTMVFRDGVELERVGHLAIPAPGQFTLDERRGVVLGADPAGHEIEVTTRQRWLRIEASDVTITGFRMRHAASHDAAGAIDVERPHERLTLARNTLSDTSGPVLGIASFGHSIVDNDVSRAGLGGIVLRATDRVRVQGNRVHHNGLHPQRATGWLDGGIKAFAASATITGNEIYENVGAGLFCFRCRDLVSTGNTMRDNGGAAIRLLMSRDGEIGSNRMLRNGWLALPREPAVIVKESHSVAVRSNILAESPGGVFIGRSDERDPPRERAPLCSVPSGNSIEDNVLIDSGTLEGLRLALDGDDAAPGCPSNAVGRNRVWDRRESTAAIAELVSGTAPLSDREKDGYLRIVRFGLDELRPAR